MAGATSSADTRIDAISSLVKSAKRHEFIAEKSVWDAEGDAVRTKAASVGVAMLTDLELRKLMWCNHSAQKRSAGGDAKKLEALRAETAKCEGWRAAAPAARERVSSAGSLAAAKLSADDADALAWWSHRKILRAKDAAGKLAELAKLESAGLSVPTSAELIANEQRKLDGELGDLAIGAPGSSPFLGTISSLAMPIFQVRKKEL